MSITPEGMHACDVDGCERVFASPANLGRHVQSKHGPKVAPSAGPHSDAPLGDDSARAEVPLGDGDSYIPPDGTPPPKVTRPKVAHGLTPWLSLLGLAIYNRNAYDGQVVSNGVPGFVTALDDVAQDNDALYKLLEGISKGDSPNFRLIVATLAIIIPILANHRPDSNALRNVTGALKMMPGTNIPNLAPREGKEQSDAAVDGFATMAQDLLANLPEEVVNGMGEAMANMPDDVKEAMAQQAATMFGGMAHPEKVHDEPPPAE